jgi:hypothetical protein
MQKWKFVPSSFGQATPATFCHRDLSGRTFEELIGVKKNST